MSDSPKNDLREDQHRASPSLLGADETTQTHRSDHQLPAQASGQMNGAEGANGAVSEEWKQQQAEEQAKDKERREDKIRTSRSLPRYLLRHQHIGWMALVFCLGFGIYGYFDMPQRKDPDVPLRVAMVQVDWPGASAEMVERLVTEKIEQQVGQNKLVDNMRSTVRTGRSNTIVELVDEKTYDIDAQLQDIGIRLDQIHDLPQGAGPIQYIKDFGDTAALMLTIASPPADVNVVREKANLAADAIRKLRGSDDSTRTSLVIAYPPTANQQLIEERARVLANDLGTSGALQDQRFFSSAQFVIVDGESRGTPQQLLQRVQEIARDHFQTDEIDPDIWSPVVVHDVSKINDEFMKVAPDKYTYRELNDWSDELAKSLKTVDYVSRTQRTGNIDEDVYLNYSQDKMAKLGISPQSVMQAFSQRNLANTGPTQDIGGRNLDVQTASQFSNLEDIANAYVPSSDNQTHRVRDFADVERTYVSPPAFLNRFGRRDESGHWITTRAVTLSLNMRPNKQIATFGEKVDRQLELVKKQLPADLVYARTSDQPQQVKENVDLFMRALMEAVVLVVLVAIVGFGSWRSSLLLATAIPITLCITFGLMKLAGMDLQQVTIATLIIALGLLVDVPVVATDAIQREMGNGVPRALASWIGPGKLFVAMSFATITNIAAYGPFLAMPGDIGRFLVGLPVVISASLLAALLVSMSFLPMMASYLLKPKPEPSLEELRTKGWTARYFRLVKWAIEHRKRAFAFSLILLFLGLGSAFFLHSEFFPTDLQYLSYADVWLPQDATLADTTRATKQVEEVILSVADQYGQDHTKHGKPQQIIHYMTSFIGGGAPRFWSSAQPEPPKLNYGEVLVETNDKRNTHDLVRLWQTALSQHVPGARVDMRELETGSAVGIPIQIRLSGNDQTELRRQAEKIKEIFRAQPLSVRINDDWGHEAIEATAHLNPDRAADLNMTAQDMDQSLRAGLQGLHVGDLRTGDKQIPLMLRLRMEERANAGDLKSLYVYSANGQRAVPLPQIADVTYDKTPMNLFRYQQFPTITVQCFPVSGHLASEVLSPSMKELRRFEANLPPGITMEIAAEFKEQNKGFKNLTIVLGISIVMIYMALLAQFKHAVKPLLVFAAIPYGVVGALLLLLAMGTPFGFMAFLGVISLIGVIVSHIIVLFDLIEERREAGEPIEDALIDAGLLRMRPVLITVFATVTALIPLALEGGPLWQPMCYAQIGGLLFATVVTLILVPVLYSISVLDLKIIAWEPSQTEEERETKQEEQKQGKRADPSIEAQDPTTSPA